MKNITCKILIVIVTIIGALFIFKIIKSFTTTKPLLVEIQENKLSNELYEEEKIKKIVREYLISSPEIIIQSIEGLQQRRAKENETEVSERIKNNKKNIENDVQYPSLGNKEGTVSVIIFFDYGCSYCKRGDNIMNQLLKSDPSVKVVLRPLPVLGNASEHMAKIALAVFKSNSSKFKDIHKGLMEMQGVTKESVENLLSKNGLDASEIEALAYSKEISDLIEKDIELARNLKVQGVPVYLINDYLISGLTDLEQLQKIIKGVKTDNP